MKDFSKIHCNINFVDGVFVEILDFYSQNYLIEFYENTGRGWSLVSHSILYPNTWFKYVAKKFRNNWRVLVYGWYDNNPELLVQHTFNESDEKVLLNFKSDSYKESLEWAKLAVKYKDNTQCNLEIYSKFSERLKNNISDKKITFLSDKPEFTNFGCPYYAEFKIGKYHFTHNAYGEWGSGWPIYQNHTKPNVSDQHRTDWLGLSSTELFNDIMNL
jgi:hypothetical protein